MNKSFKNKEYTNRKIQKYKKIKAIKEVIIINWNYRKEILITN